MIYRKPFTHALDLPFDKLLKLDYTYHARHRSIRKGEYKLLTLPKTITFDIYNLLEVEKTKKDKIKKIKVEKHFDSKRNIIFILNPNQKGKAIVITFWLVAKTHHLL